MAESRWNLNTLLTSLSALSLLLSTLLLVAGDPAMIGQAAPLFPGIVLALVLLFWQRPWFYLLTGILLAAFPLVVLFVFGAYNGLLHPGSGTEGMSLWLLLLAAILGLLGGIGGFVQGRRGAHAPAAHMTRAGHGVAAFAAVCLVLGAIGTSALASADLRSITERPAAHIEADETVHVVLETYVFAPRDIAIPVGKLVNLEIENADPTLHTFAYMLDGVTYETPIPAGSTVTIPMKFDTAQEIHFWCSPHSGGAGDTSDDSMTGTLTVA